MKRVILDASFVRGCPTDGTWLTELAKRFDRLIVIDTLGYELCSTDNLQQWPAALRKFQPVKENIDVWVHTSTMLKFESKKRMAYQDPRDETNSQRLRDAIKAQQAIDWEQAELNGFKAQREIISPASHLKLKSDLGSRLDGLR